MDILFKDLKIGDMFTLNSKLPNTNQYVNMKVPESIMKEHEHPFNVINLVTGNPRTFNENEKILKIVGRTIHLANTNTK